MLAPNSWDTGLYRWEGRYVLFEFLDLLVLASVRCRPMEKKRNFLHFAGVGWPLHPLWVSLRLSSCHCLCIGTQWWCTLYKLLPRWPCALDLVWIFVSLLVIQVTINHLQHLRYWIPFSTVVHLPGWHIAFSLKGCLSLMPDRSCLQKLRTSAPFPITLLIPPSLERDPSCLASLPSNSRLLPSLWQNQSGQVTMCSPGWGLKSFCISHSSLRDQDRVVSYSFMSSVSSPFCSCDGPASSSSSSWYLRGDTASSHTIWADFHCCCFFLTTGVADTIVG